MVQINKNINYKNKYLKYKLKFEKLKLKGGMESNDDVEIFQTLTREEAQEEHDRNVPVISLLSDDDEPIAPAP